MASLANRFFLCLGVLLATSNLSYANLSQNTYTTTLSILSYAKINTDQPNLCIIANDSTISNQFSHFIKLHKYKYRITSINANEVKSTRCDAIFFGDSTPSTEQSTINRSMNASVLSFSINNTECELGSTFCLYSTKTGNTLFKVNLDSLSRSNIHIDPRVLLLARNAE